MPTFTWKIIEMITAPSEGELSDVIKTVRAKYTIHDDAGKEFSRLYVFDLPSADPSNFVAYNDLTESNVLTWITSTLNLEEEQLLLQNLLQETLEGRLIDGTSRKPLPWT
jgi:hypothetical protein